MVAFITGSFLQREQHQCSNRRSSAMESTQSSSPVSPVSVVNGLPSWNEQLRDGSQVLIRPINSADAPAEGAFIEALSADARHNRFLGQVGHPSDAMVRHFVDLDFVHDLAFVAVEKKGDADVFLGVGVTARARIRPRASALSACSTHGRDVVWVLH
jgi:hypothetical protein